jgi:hypothetical protein
MGYSVNAYVVYGVKCDVDELRPMVRVRGCKHPEAKSKFCPECGQPMFIMEEAELDLGWESDSNTLGIFSSHEESQQQVVGFILNNIGIYDNGVEEIGDATDEMEEQIVDWFQNRGMSIDKDEITHYVILSQSA